MQVCRIGMAREEYERSASTCASVRLVRVARKHGVGGWSPAEHRARTKGEAQRSRVYDASRRGRCMVRGDSVIASRASAHTGERRVGSKWRCRLLRQVLRYREDDACGVQLTSCSRSASHKLWRCGQPDARSRRFLHSGRAFRIPTAGAERQRSRYEVGGSAWWANARTACTVGIVGRAAAMPNGSAEQDDTDCLTGSSIGLGVAMGILACSLRASSGRRRYQAICPPPASLPVP
ncbi:hypothetical protein EXIGLDRAFT_141397 [Exidia glandulosa HHB12029]|uniref:Uncharacterized protein n=1 Tax=Exidia glandulosa HHB12029 TaxID=1314781 RepID=A0A165FVF2_EXIGL|nr:hypothetical protein EXIGLDRAFT_141397 [Exidia glandulosa HHB12029]